MSFEAAVETNYDVELQINAPNPTTKVERETVGADYSPISRYGFVQLNNIRDSLPTVEDASDITAVDVSGVVASGGASLLAFFQLGFVPKDAPVSLATEIFDVDYDRTELFTGVFEDDEAPLGDGDTWRFSDVHDTTDLLNFIRARWTDGADVCLCFKGDSGGDYSALYGIRNTAKHKSPSLVVTVPGAVETLNPLTKVYNAMWALLESNSAFTSLVKPGNRVKYGAEAPSNDPIKREVSSVDFPEVRIVAASHTPSTHPCTGKYRMTYRFEIQIASGSMLFDESSFPVQWSVFQAMKNIPDILQSLTWNGEKFVVFAKPTTAVDSIREFDLKRGIEGWASIWVMDVDMWFTPSRL